METKRRILVADDDPDLVELLEMDLTSQGYEITTATNGREALHMLTYNPFDLVLLDVMMPYVDGYHVAQEIAARQAPKPPKIVIMTSRDTSREHGVILMSGADSFIQKPFGLAELHKKLKETLGE